MINWIRTDKELPKKPDYYLCVYANNIYNVLWFEDDKFYSKKYGVRRYDRYGVKTVKAWAYINKSEG